MPRFFDDYSNTYLTHDSSAGRKQQRRGWKFRENFRIHYEHFLNDWRRGPMGLASAQQAFIRARGPDDPLIPPLPDGWKAELDEITGIYYYVHAANATRTWVRPGFIPPPPGTPLPPPLFHHAQPAMHASAQIPPPPQHPGVGSNSLGAGLPPPLPSHMNIPPPPPPPSHLNIPPPPPPPSHMNIPPPPQPIHLNIPHPPLPPPPSS